MVRTDEVESVGGGVCGERRDVVSVEPEQMRLLRNGVGDSAYRLYALILLPRATNNRQNVNVCLYALILPPPTQQTTDKMSTSHNAQTVLLFVMIMRFVVV